MSPNPDVPSATCRSAAAEAAPAAMAGNGQEGAGASSGMPVAEGCQGETYPLADRWNFRLLA